MISPWIESAQPPPIEKTIVDTVYFPDEDESIGDIVTALFGPDCNDPVLSAALEVILTYLAGSSASVIENIMVEKERLANSITYDWDSRPNTVIWLQCSGVATEKLAFVEQRLFELVKQVASKPLNMKYILECIRRQRRQLEFQAESTMGHFTTAVINDFLFGKRDGSTLKYLSSVKQYDVLEGWSDEDWRKFLKNWISDASHISILGTPSSKLADEIKSSEKARVEARKKELGPEGLEKLSEKLKAAITKNKTDIPAEILRDFPVPDVESIHLIESVTARSGLAKKLGEPNNRIQKIIDSEPDLPLFIQFEHVPTNFVHITLLLGTSEIENNLRPLLPLFFSNFFNTPIIKDGKKLDFEEVVTCLEQDTISYSTEGGKIVGSSEGIAIVFVVAPGKYSTAVEWIRTMMFDSVYDETRLSAGVAKILAEIPELKRDGRYMANAVDIMIHLGENSNIKARSTLVKATYMKRLKKSLLKDPQAVISSFEVLRRSLFRFSNMRVLVIADIEKLQNPVDVWKALIMDLDTNEPLLPLVKTTQCFSADGKNPGEYGVVIVPMPTIDSSFCLSTVRGPTSPTDPVLPALKVAISLLGSIEGPLWTEVRGKGLAYGVDFRCEVDGHIQLSIYRSPNSYKAFQAAKHVIESFVNGTTQIGLFAFEGAISGIVASFAENQSTLANAGNQHFINSVAKEVNDDYDIAMLKAVRNVRSFQVILAMKNYLLPLFIPGKANIVLACASIMKEVCILIHFIMILSLYIFLSLLVIDFSFSPKTGSL